MTSIADIGISSLLANQYALMVTSQNIANASTPYYSRRIMEFTEAAFNSGVTVSDARRVIDVTADANAQIAQTDFSQAEKYLDLVSNLELTLDDDTTSISNKMIAVRSALDKLNIDVTSMQSRGLLLGALSALANRFQSLNGTLNQEAQVTNQSITNNMTQINNLLSTIADINNRVTSTVGQDSPELLDTRNAKVQELAKYFNFTTSVDAQGMMNISLANGFTVVAGTRALTMNTVDDPADPNGLKIAFRDSANNIDVSNFITSGELAGLVKYRNNVLSEAQRSLGRLALAFADKFNAQNKLGMNANGDLGSNILTDVNDSSLVASRTVANGNNTGSGSFTVTIDDVGALTTSDYRLTIGTSNAYTVTRVSDNTVVASGTLTGVFPQTIASSDNSFSLNVTGGTFSEGDQYTISPTKNAANAFNLTNNDPAQIALSYPVSASVGTQQQGSTGKIEVTEITDTTTADFTTTPHELTPPLRIHFLTATTYEIIDASSSTVLEGPLNYTPSSTDQDVFPTPGGYDPGYRIKLSGTMQADDTFNITYNTNVGDNKNGLAMSKLFAENVLANESYTFEQGYHVLAGNVSSEVSKAQSDYSVRGALKKQADDRRNTISGVSLAEETMNLGLYQQSYQASAQILQVARAVFDTIISMTR